MLKPYDLEALTFDIFSTVEIIEKKKRMERVVLCGYSTIRIFPCRCEVWKHYPRLGTASCDPAYDQPAVDGPGGSRGRAAAHPGQAAGDADGSRGFVPAEGGGDRIPDGKTMRDITDQDDLLGGTSETLLSQKP